jgi:hypothetical protein
MRLRGISRKFLAVTALFALLAATTPALADSLSASDLPACCNTSYCPLHHRQGRDMEKDKSICDAHRKAGAADCSMRACDATPPEAAGTAPFTPAAPVTVFYETTAQPAPVSWAAFAPFLVSMPATPPPRMRPS